MTAYKVLRRLKCLRGTPFDPLGYSADRRTERRLIEDFRVLVENIVDRLEQHNLAVAVELAGAALAIAGYGPVKEAAIVEYQTRLKVLLEEFGKQSEDRILAAG